MTTRVTYQAGASRKPTAGAYQGTVALPLEPGKPAREAWVVADGERTASMHVVVDPRSRRVLVHFESRARKAETLAHDAWEQVLHVAAARGHDTARTLNYFAGLIDSEPVPAWLD